ncbi:MAG: class I SAM-dependent methyltransferase [Gammaproteobacteria bacterium]|nr:class I SAM-dependent methyltransferase [Gammaproteobacteria bacterium]
MKNTFSSIKRLMKFIKGIFSISLRLNIKIIIALFHLYREGSDVSRLLAGVLEETVCNSTNRDEQVWIEKIELLRKNLESSNTEILVEDYGAGSQYLDLASKEMNRNKIVTRTVGEICRNASKTGFWSFLLFKLIRKFGVSACLELGTCLGISTSYIAAALKLSGAGKITTLEGAESLASLASENFHKLDLDNVKIIVGRFQDTLNKVLNENGDMDFVFIDGHHDEKATLAYFEQVIPFLAERALLVLDDITWSEGMNRAWKTITEDKRIKISVDLRDIGICVLN